MGRKPRSIARNGLHPERALDDAARLDPQPRRVTKAIARGRAMAYGRVGVRSKPQRRRRGTSAMMVSLDGRPGGRFEPLSSRSASGEEQEPALELVGPEAAYLAGELAGLEGRRAGAARRFLGGCAGAGRGLELDELAHRPGQERDQTKAAIARVVDVVERGERGPEIAPADGVHQLPHRALAHADEASRDGVLGDGLPGADVEREPLYRVDDARQLGPGDLGEQIGHSRSTDGRGRSLRGRRNRAGRRGGAARTLRESPPCARAFIELRRPSIFAP